ncbi:MULTISPECIES: AI-2E family transporter [unclassified Streptococcus]|uniref:AI-2E family transporter n=1 Tax=unclassified Streptococcus TaxID=2608887 RepID=UPI0010716D7F|nr:MULTISPECIES: AI-2E family transporter [unclassified Streptococcus]MBF0806212.1 AI-2E family transporter [Streptococcus sp. 19428wA2_WM07]TFU28195.1 AI-2E family transporter [Streptococcus sp. WM07]
MFQKSKLFFWTVEILLCSLVLFLWREMGEIVTPAVRVLNTILIPFLLAAFFYYITNPLVEFLEKVFKIKRGLGSLMAVAGVIGLIVWAVIYLLPILINQLTSLIYASQGIYHEAQSLVNHLAEEPILRNVDIQKTVADLNLSYVDILQNILNNVSTSIGSLFSAVINTAFILIMTPIFLVYFLLDGKKLLPMLQRTVLKRDSLDIASLLTTLNKTIARYISGISIDALIIFTLTLTGYSIIGIRYALVFAIFQGMCNLIPYVGPTIGMIPMLITYTFLDPQKMFIALIYMLILQQVDGNILYPRIVGGVMKVHPITIMILLLLSSNIYGIVGMIVAIPLYSILKEIVKFAWELYEHHKENQMRKQLDTDL